MKLFASTYLFALAVALLVCVPNSRAHEKDGNAEAAHPSAPGSEAGKVDHSATSGDAPEKMDHGKMSDGAAQQGATPAPDAKQLEASRAQLEASRLQLEASRQQLKAAESKAGESSQGPAMQHDKASSSMDHAEHQEPEAKAKMGGSHGNVMLEHFNDPAYMHVLMNPLPVYGLSMGVLALCVALIFRSRPTIIAALILVAVSSLSAWPTYHYGQAAYDRVKEMSDSAGGQWLDEHMARAEKLIYAFYVLAAVALAGIVAPIKWPRASLPLAILTLILGFGTLGVGGWISYAGGHVRHKEFRFEGPPPARSQEHHHHHDGEDATDHDAPHGEQTEGQSKPESEGHTHQH